MRFKAPLLLALVLSVIPAIGQQNADSTPTGMESRADALRSQKDYVAAANLYKDALHKAPKNAVLWNKLGMTELVIGSGAQGFERSSRFNSARMDFERATKLRKDYADAFNNLGVVYYILGDYRKAISRYKEALALRDSASFHSNLGSVYFAQKKVALAMNEYLLALQLDPGVFERSSTTGLIGRVSRPEERAKYAFMLARLYAKVGDVDHAITQIRTALENGYSELDPLYKDQVFAAVRNDPRFLQLMENKPPAIPN
ncbi:MAG: tetratricopeptide repeat protein [Terriglobia bacterium]|nr:tetratricopeptide repeat protein [Terriglobia bacterium]